MKVGGSMQLIVLGLTSLFLSVKKIGAFTLLTTTTTTTPSIIKKKTITTSSLFLSSSPSDGDDETRARIFREESLNADNLKASSEMMKNMSEQDIENMIREMDNMPAAQLNQMKAMGMDPAIMKQTMNMIKDNPSMRKSMAEMMGQMSPEEIMERSRQAQESIKNMNQMSTPPTTAASTPATATTSNANAPAVETKVTEIEDEDEDDDEDEEEDDEDKVEVDPEVLDSMFRVGEIMSGDDTSSTGVTFDGFKSLPPIAIMSSTSYGGASSSDDDLDLTLTKGELTEAWNKGSLGATRVDRAGFERVWMLIQDEYYNDIVEEARERLLFKKKQKKRGYTAPKPTAAATTTATTPMVGANVPPEMLQQQLKNLKDDDFKNMLEQMKNISPEEEARMRAMGVDPAMMQKSAEMMSNNPLLRKAATMMMKNAKPEDLMKQSQMAQEKMANMSEEDKKKFLDSMK
eukprot:CAMPEP_0178949206 /NCGR_PEP_ID=MMETSP0789-20121207/5907_1 /TAXON_ID=3005 /ORGANISM="Rhizosolenia setigera, Strain CCMP 1694" /LENGTH=459 /DNA_ID=CAMNT_0020629673 /DNA_START=63 /DNA_END=1445 /DNA_ORIENTATION=+